jgi:hypothetical protein
LGWTVHRGRSRAKEVPKVGRPEAVYLDLSVNVLRQQSDVANQCANHGALRL